MNSFALCVGEEVDGVRSQPESYVARGDRLLRGHGLLTGLRPASAGSASAERRRVRLIGRACLGLGWRGLAVVMAVVAVVLAGCSSAHTPAKQSAASGASTRAHPAAAIATLRTTDGALVRVPSAIPSVLLFITLGCADCAESAQSMARAARSLRAAHSPGDRATFLVVDLDRDLPAAHLTDFLNSVGVSGLPATINSDLTLVHKYHVAALSSVLIINPAGKVVYRAVNPTANAIIGALSTAR